MRRKGRLSSGLVVALLTVAVAGVAACGGDGGGGGSSPAAPAAPPASPPPASQRLEFRDVPRDPVMINVGQSQTVRVGVSPSVIARCSASVGDEDKVELRTEATLCQGFFEFVLTGLEPGQTPVRLEAEAAGYRSANASVDAMILRGAEIRTSRDLAWTRSSTPAELTFRDSRDLAAYVELRILLQEGDLGQEQYSDALVGFLSTVHDNDWGWFIDEDPIAWDEDTEVTAIVVLADVRPYQVPLIQVWGIPFFDDDRRFEDREEWWVMKQFTSFGRGWPEYRPLGNRRCGRARQRAVARATR